MVIKRKNNMIVLKVIIDLACVTACLLITFYPLIFPKPKEIKEKIGLWIVPVIFYVFFTGLGILVWFM